ncbi:MAG: tRNA-uridine aminocarboxypropyltransferase [Cellvibrionaceae bacterium]
MSHAFYRLREESLTHCTRPFKARGSIVKRCEKCHLALFACLCPWQLTRDSDIHFTLIVHRKELYKTTNTGRLIADLLPRSTSAYLWSRTEPDPKLLKEITNPFRRTVLLFPEDQTSIAEIQVTNSTQKDHLESAATNKNSTKDTTKEKRPLTVILLDGTWKQASRMANLSMWLQNIERLSIDQAQLNTPVDTEQQQEYRYIRKAPLKHQLSTAQAAACILRQYKDNDNAALLEHYFSVFNQHCIATRRNIKPNISDAHQALTAAKNRSTQGK